MDSRKTDIQLLKGKTAVIYGAAGAVGSALSWEFARQGAEVFLAGRTLGKVESLAKEINQAGARGRAAEVDALDEDAVARHFSAVLEQAGHVDVSFNAIGIPQEGIQGVPLSELSVEAFALPVAAYARSHFLTARTAARHMAGRRSGALLMHTPEPARLGAPLVGGMGPAWASMEALCRALSAEVGPQGVRVLCLRTTGIPETATIDTVFSLHARAHGIAREQFQSLMESSTHRKRSTGLSELAYAAAFAASDLASAMTGAVLNLTGGAIVD
jgi:NAD(P)-dependent dehydrogenase (short-subunit alcohol dehydrogenase family)